jgi:hypothetical protein
VVFNRKRDHIEHALRRHTANTLALVYARGRIIEIIMANVLASGNLRSAQAESSAA